MDCRYITSALKPEQLPPFELPEIAFIGRSNSGKSSLINALLNSTKLARHGRTPGQTQMINFFSINDRLIFADLPGYGFSAIQKDVARHWQPLVDAYVARPNICEFLILIDTRRELNDEDWELLFILGRNLPLYIVLTKSDKLARQAVNARIKLLTEAVTAKGVAVKKIVAVSSLKKQGIEALRDELFTHMAEGAEQEVD
jgi:GTP-binding protein